MTFLASGLIGNKSDKRKGEMMKEITRNELKQILKDHVDWLKGESGKRAYLRGADLRDAYLGGADLRDAYLRGADLRDAYLGGADLGGADLGGADLRDAYLRDADLRDAYLRGADLRDAYLGGAYLGGADLRGAENVDYPIACPEKGAFIGFKKLRSGLIAKLQIPEDAQRLSASTRKCRASKAVVISIMDGEKEVAEGYSKHDSNFKYVVGETIEPKEPFEPDRWKECASGIHFFITQKEAEEY